MFATLFVGALVKLGARSFASFTGSLVKLKKGRRVAKEAEGNGGHLHVETVVVNDAELEALKANAHWVAGHARAKAYQEAAA